MGIKGLSKVLADHSPDAIKEGEFKHYFGRKVAIDASMSIYQFLIQVRSGGENLTNEDGETTSHLIGIFYRTIRMLNNGIKPVYVFDGKPPTMKGGELLKRGERRKQAEVELSEAQQKGDEEEVEKFTKRLVKVTHQHNADVQELLTLMGVPVVKAPCEAEAQCSELVKGGKVYATATEDMDALTFGTTRLLRNLTAAEARKLPVREYSVEKVLEGLGMDMPQFIDMCILLGCDYCDKIAGIGPHKAYGLIKEHKSIEKILETLDPKKNIVPDDWPYVEARKLFVNPDVTKCEDCDLKWTDPDVDGLVKFLCEKNGFDETRVRSAAAKISKARTVKPQGRLDTFFKALPASSNDKKRKLDAAKKAKDAAKAKKAKTSAKKKK